MTSFMILAIPMLMTASPADTGARNNGVIPPITAISLDSPVTIDGRLDEAAWQRPAMASGFIQAQPDEGAPATERSEVWVAVDESAIYVAARLRDDSPDSVLALLTRRDRESQSDFFTLYLDPLHDGRTGYQFTVSAAGQQSDGTLYNDDFSDDAWDGVWQSAVRQDSLGWTVEMRIPVSQMRLLGGVQRIWGVNFDRGIGRRGEVSSLVPHLRSISGFVSRFVDLGGLEVVKPRRRLEVVPYVTARADYRRAAAGDPFHDGSDMSGSLGGDLRMGLGGSMQLALTVNPDFGQVEVDPAVVNLSDVETFFEERRPFFVEGSSNFRFGQGGASNFMGFNWVDNEPFYSRRIGRAPQLDIAGADYSDVPQGTRILGAAKVTGRAAGWNVGFLGAATERTRARVSIAGTESNPEVEPFTGFGVARLQRDIAGGRHGIGMLATWTGRDLDDSQLRNSLNADAAVLGLDGWATLDHDRKWVLSGWGTWSRVSGSRERIAALQQGPTHYFQRPDAGEVSFDSTRTALTGTFARLALNKQKGAIFFNSAVGAVSPGYDNNDLGYIGRTDLLNAHVASGYQWTKPGSWYNRASAVAAVFGRWNFGGVRTGSGVWNQNRVTLHNFNQIELQTFVSNSRLDDRATRGGPLMFQPAEVQLSGSWSSDGRKGFVVGVEGSRFVQADDGERGWTISPSISWRPAPNINLSIGPEYAANHNAAQFLTHVVDPLATATFGERQVFGVLEQRTLSADIRLNWTFTPKLSLELFAQPLVSSGRYTTIRELRQPRSFDFLDYGTGGSTIDRVAGTVDPDGSGPAAAFSIGQPDFTVASLRGNAILRWEFSPGSALFLVWTQDRTIQNAEGDFRPRHAFNTLFDAPGRNVLLVKMSYWMGR